MRKINTNLNKMTSSMWCKYANVPVTNASLQGAVAQAQHLAGILKDMDVHDPAYARLLQEMHIEWHIAAAVETTLTGGLTTLTADPRTLLVDYTTTKGENVTEYVEVLTPKYMQKPEWMSQFTRDLIEQCQVDTRQPIEVAE